MIALQLPARAETVRRYVIRLNDTQENDPGPGDAVLISDRGRQKVYASEYGLLEISAIDEAEFDGDVVCVDGTKGYAERLIRSRSAHNTFLVTERCDQLCIMCSQPPKKTHNDRWQEFFEAARLAPRDAVLGITGGEPTLYKHDLFELISRIGEVRPDIGWHVLSNAQHFASEDVQTLCSQAFRQVTWGIPIYAADSALHDRIVGKAGAFRELGKGLAILLRAAARVELRTVLLSDNIQQLPALGRYAGLHLGFCEQWSIMQLEAMGFARRRFPQLFVPSLENFPPIAHAIDAAELHGLPTVLFNMPRCHVPPDYRRHAAASISDWKRKFTEDCDACHEKQLCGGFFEWHPAEAMGVVPL